MDDFAHRQLCDFAANCAGNIGDLKDLCWHVPRSSVAPDLIPNALTESLVERHPRPQHNKQHHADIVLPRLTHYHAIHHFGDTLHLPINLGGTNTHATRIEHRVGSAVDNKATLGGHLAVIAVSPDAGPAIKVSPPKLTAICVLPEPHWAGGKRLGTDQLSLFADHRFSCLVPDRSGHTESGGLQLARIDR